MERKIQSLSEHVSFLYNELEIKETEIDDLKKSLDDANDKCRRKAAATSFEQDGIIELTKIVDEQKVKITCLRKHRNEILDKYENMVDDYEAEFKSKEHDIKKLQEDSEHQKIEISDLKEELSAKLIEISTQKEKIQKMESENEANLSEELSMANFNIENEKLHTENAELKSKAKIFKQNCDRKMQYFAKMEKISDGMKNDLDHLKLSIAKLKRSWNNEKCTLGWKCNRIFCSLNHTHLFRKINFLKNPENSASSKRKSSEEKVFECEQCGLKCSRDSQLAIHKRLKHEECVNFRCTHCPFKCSVDKQLERHVKKKHTFSCNKCDGIYVCKNDIKEHQQKHLETQKRKAKTKFSKSKNNEECEVAEQQNDYLENENVLDHNDLESENDINEEISVFSEESETSSLTSSSSSSSSAEEF